MARLLGNPGEPVMIVVRLDHRFAVSPYGILSWMSPRRPDSKLLVDWFFEVMDSLGGGSHAIVFELAVSDGRKICTHAEFAVRGTKDEMIRAFADIRLDDLTRRWDGPVLAPI